MYDNTWVLGYGEIDDKRPYGHTNITFYNNKVDTQFINRKYEIIRCTASYSDSITGDLLLYSNGCGIFDAMDSVLKGGEIINPGITHDLYCENGYPAIQNICFINDPYNRDRIYLFHQAWDYDDTIFGRQYVSIIDRSSSNWVVTEANKLLIRNPLFNNSFKAVKHANGIDWWIMNFNYASDTLITFRTSINGIKGPFKQFFPVKRGSRDWTASSCLSPNGEILVRADLRSGISIMKFNRQSGILSDLKYLPMWITNEDSVRNLLVTGCSISPNNKYLYFSTPIDIWQFDLEEENIVDGMIHIDTYDGSQAPFASTFYSHQIGPDNKIYLNCTNGELVMHVIDQPDLKGKACNFLQHGLVLPAYNGFALPYFPNYKLGPLTNNIVEQINKPYIKVYPNPNNGSFTIIKANTSQKLNYTILNSFGQVIKQLEDRHFEKVQLDLTVQPSGIYFLIAKNMDISDTSKIRIEKFIISK